MSTLSAALDYGNKGVQDMNIIGLFPWFQYLPIKCVQTIKMCRKKMDSFIKVKFDQHKQKLDSDNPTNLLDWFLKAGID